MKNRQQRKIKDQRSSTTHKEPISLRVQIPKKCNRCGRELEPRGDLWDIVKHDDDSISEILECPRKHLFRVIYVPISVFELVEDNFLNIDRK